MCQVIRTRWHTFHIFGNPIKNMKHMKTYCKENIDAFINLEI